MLQITFQSNFRMSDFDENAEIVKSIQYFSESVKERKKLSIKNEELIAYSISCVITYCQVILFRRFLK